MPVWSMATLQDIHANGNSEIFERKKMDKADMKNAIGEYLLDES